MGVFVEVVRAVVEFAEATDRRDWDALAALMVDDVEAYGRRGRARAVANMRMHLDGVGPTQHLLGNHRVEPVTGGAGDRARARTYGRVHHVGLGAMEGRFYECMGDYDDTWVRVDGTWRMAHRWFEIRIELGDRGVLGPAVGSPPG